MVLRDSDSPRCGCLEGVEETEPGAVARVCIPHPCRNGSDSETVCRRTHKTRTLLAVEAILSPKEPDSHKHPHVHSRWRAGRDLVEMERAVGCSWIECGNRILTVGDEQRSV